MLAQPDLDRALADAPARRERLALMISMVCAVGLGILALTRGMLFGTIFCGMFAFENFKRLRHEPAGPLTPPGAP